MSRVIRKKVKGENRVKNIISARVLGGLAAMMLVVASIIGFNQQTDTAQAAATGKINLVNNWSKLSTASSPSKLASTYGGTTPTYVGAGKSLYATYTSTGRHIMTGSNQLVIEVVDSDLNSAVVKSTIVILKGGHSSSSTLITNYQEANDAINEYAIPIIDTNGDGVITGSDLTLACRWLGSGYEDEDGSGSSGIGTGFYSEAVAITALSTADSLLDGTTLANGPAGATAANVLTDATAGTVALGRDGQKADMTLSDKALAPDANMGNFNRSPKCSSTTSSLIALSVGNAGDPANGVPAIITVQTGTGALAEPDAASWSAGDNDDDEAQAGESDHTNVVAGLVQWKTSRINTTTAKVWSGVVSSSNAISILLTETGRNTGVFNGLVNVFDNENTAMPLGMAANNATTNDADTVYMGSYGNTNALTPCADECATGAGRAGHSVTSTLAVKDGGTVYAEYVDAVDADSNTSQKRQVTAKIDATVPSVAINSPAHSSENQTRTPSFSVTATEAASGLDVSGALLIVQEGSETDNGTGEDGSVGATNGIDVMVTSALHDATGDDDGNGGEWLTTYTKQM